MKLSLLHAEELNDFSRLRDDLRLEVRAWLDCITQLQNTARGNTSQIIGTICARMQCTPGTVYRKLKAFQTRGWHGLVNEAKCPGLRGQPQAFKDYVSALYLHHQRDTSGREVHRVICSAWSLWKRTNDPLHAIPGYHTPPPAGPKGYPPGFSAKNLSRFCPDQHALRLIRQGTKAASNFLPSILKTRVGTKFGQVVFWDDQDYDNKIVAPGTAMKAMRPQGFNCIDYYSGSFLDYTIRTRYLDLDTDTLKSLSQKDFCWFVVTYLQRHGYRNDEDGTIFVFEHGTASGYNNRKLATTQGHHDFDAALAFATGDKVTVERSGLFNQPAFSGMLFRPASSGNFRFKSPLEGMFNLVRNYSSSIVGQIGLNARSHGPEENHGLEIYTNQLLKIHATLTPDKQQLLSYPFLKLDQFGQIMDAVYHAINSRTDHDLEGWDRLGHTLPLIRFAPSEAAPWITQAELAQMPKRTQELALSLLDQPGYTMPAKLSPHQVATAHRHQLTKLPDAAVPLLIPTEWAKKVRVKSDRTISIKDQLCGDEPYTYLARIVTRNGSEMLRPDLEVLAYFNPICPGKLCICDMNGSYIGTLNATTRVAFTDHETMLERLGERSAIKADLEAPTRAAMATTIHQRQTMKAHNHRLEHGLPVTPEEIATARTAAGQQAHRTAAANRLQAHGQPSDWDTHTPETPPAPSIWDTLPDDETLPDAF